MKSTTKFLIIIKLKLFMFSPKINRHQRKQNRGNRILRAFELKNKHDKGLKKVLRVYSDGSFTKEKYRSTHLNSLLT